MMHEPEIFQDTLALFSVLRRSRLLENTLCNLELS